MDTKAKVTNFLVSIVATQSRLIKFDSRCWSMWQHHCGPIEGYVFQTGLHHGVCIRQPNTDPGTNTAIRIDLQLDSGNWYVLIRPTNWLPERQLDNSRFISQHDWHAASALMAVAMYGNQFGDYNLAFRNCREWCRGLLKFMDQDELREKVSIQPVTDFDKLRELAIALNIGLDQYSELDVGGE